MERRSFLMRSGLALGAIAAARPERAFAEGTTQPENPQDWGWVRSQFDLLDPKLAHFAGFYLVSHPKTVRAAIEGHRAGLDRNPVGYQHEHGMELEDRVRAAAGKFLGVD